MKTIFNTEREGQIAFFDNYGIDWSQNDEILANNTDGIYNGNIFEFKLNINNVNSVLFQAIKYLSRLRLKGENVPAKILLISLNEYKCYCYSSANYIDNIQKIYTGAMSKHNAGFIGGSPDKIFDYSNQLDSSKLKKLWTNNKIIQEKYIPIDIDENCIVGWGNRYYHENPNANKGDFLGDETGTKVSVIGEIREPKHFKYLINPYKGKTNEKFKYLMDCLNDKLNKKDLGAFYTPPLYAAKAASLVLKAVNNVPKDNDYIILDRCAGTGNLEDALINLKDKNGNKLIDHVIVSTYEYYEYKVLNERLGHLVREIIPPSEAEVIYANGKVSNADAMSQDFIDNPIIKQYLDNSKCNFIIFENPPFRDDTSGMTGIKASNFTKQNNYVLQEMKKVGGLKTNEMSGRFIWSAFKYYLNKPHDSLVILSPIKYYKADHIINKNFVEGFIFNRKEFHNSAAAVSCILWNNDKINKINKNLVACSIEDNKLKQVATLPLFQTFNGITKLFPQKIKDKKYLSHYFSTTNGVLDIDERKASYFNTDILCFIVGAGFGISNPNLNFNLTRFQTKSKNVVTPLTKSNYLDYMWLLPIKHYLMFCRQWYETEFMYCCADGGNAYLKDKEFMQACFIFTCFNYYNKCLSTKLPNNIIVQNELCFDTDTIASEHLELLQLNKEETQLFSLWTQILKLAKKTNKYNSNFKYGPYQIEIQLDTYKEIKRGNKIDKIYDYPELHGNLQSLKELLKEYFNKFIKDKLFKYQLIK